MFPQWVSEFKAGDQPVETQTGSGPSGSDSGSQPSNGAWRKHASGTLVVGMGVAVAVGLGVGL